MSLIIPGSEPFLFTAGKTGCILLHGFSATPEEMRPLGEFLRSRDFTAMGLRLAGHATQPSDLRRVRWTDWLDDVEGGLAVLDHICTRRVLIGQSMGGMIALAAAARFEVSGVVAISTPYGASFSEKALDLLARVVRPMVDKHSPRFPSDHSLYHRRELNYPAYPEVPARVLTQVDQLAAAMLNALPGVKAPALVVQSRDDSSVPYESMQKIFDRLGSTQKEMLPMDGIDHSMVLDPRRQQVFEAIHQFLLRIGV